MKKDLTYEAWLRTTGQIHAYTCEGDGWQDCTRRAVGHFYNDAHASANGWEVSDLPVCPSCLADVVRFGVTMFDEVEEFATTARNEWLLSYEVAL